MIDSHENTQAIEKNKHTHTITYMIQMFHLHSKPKSATRNRLLNTNITISPYPKCSIPTSWPECCSIRRDGYVAHSVLMVVPQGQVITLQCHMTGPPHSIQYRLYLEDVPCPDCVVIIASKENTTTLGEIECWRPKQNARLGVHLDLLVSSQVKQMNLCKKHISILYD